MDFDSERYAKIINHAATVKQDIFEQLEEIIGEDVTEDDAVIFFSALAVMCRMTSQLARAVSGQPVEQVKQMLREDCARSKIILQEMLSNLRSEVISETGTDEVVKFLEGVEFFDYPDAEVAKWNLNIDQPLNVAQ